MSFFEACRRFVTSLAHVMVLASLAVLSADRARAQDDAVPEQALALTNTGLEETAVGEVPEGWKASRRGLEAGFTMGVVEEAPSEGARCLRIARAPEDEAKGGFGTIVRRFDATPWRGKRVRFGAAVRCRGASPLAQAQLWMRVDRADKQRGFFDNMHDRPITSNDWSHHAIEGEVAPDAEWLNVGFMLLGSGEAHVDALSFEVLGDVLPPGEGDVAARALSSRGLKNLITFTRLFGYVRYFHPSDGAAATDWESFARRGVQAVEPARNLRELNRILEELFTPLAPTVAITRNRRGAATPSVLRELSRRDDLHLTRWHHQGIGIQKPSTYESNRIDDQAPGSDDPSAVSQLVDSSDLGGQTVRFSVAVRTEGAETSEVRLFAGDLATIRAVLPRDPDAFQGPAIASPGWSRHEVVTTLPADTHRLVVGIGIAGTGRAWIDDARLETTNGTRLSGLANAGMERLSDAGPTGWHPRASRSAEFSMSSSESTSEGEASMLLESRLELPEFPSPLEPFVASLDGGLTVSVPLTCFADDEGTQPPSQAWPATDLNRPDGWRPSGNDRTTRLANVVLAWNVFQHFYPYFDVIPGDWSTTLERSLRSAALDADEGEHVGTLRRLVADLHDGHGRVTHPADGHRTALPLLWDWVEDRLVVTRVLENDETLEASGIRAGDIVRRIDGVSVEERLAEHEREISSPSFARRRLSGLTILLTGPRDQPAELEIQRGDVVFHAELAYSMPRTDLTEVRPDEVTELRPGILYVDLDRIDEEGFQEALPRLDEADGIVFDLRGYPGKLSTVVISHLIDEPVRCAQWHVPVAWRPDREQTEFAFSDWSVEPKEPRLRARVAFVTNGIAISYAETYLGIIEHYRLAEIVGEPTAATNGNINPFTLPGGYWVNWTGMKVLKHDGSRHHGVGILPTVPTSRTIEGVRLGRDELLDRAVEVVSTKASPRRSR
ncbi:MAG: S41 family peptidase [Acidobacteriota bacterium]